MMTPVRPIITTILLLLLLFLVRATAYLPKSDKNLLEFALNLEYLEAEFFSYGSMGKGLDDIQANLTSGGARPIGVRIAKLTPYVRNVIAQFAFQEVGHIRAIKSVVTGGFPRPLLNLSVQAFATTMNKAFGRPLFPDFNPYANDINFLLSSYIIPYVGLTGYVGANANLQSATARKLVGGLLGVESGQDAVIRSLLHKLARVRVIPYRITVGEFTNRISDLRNKLGHTGPKDNGLLAGPLLVADANSLSFGRQPQEILRIVYGTGKEQIPGGFYPEGASGTIAKTYLKTR